MILQHSIAATYRYRNIYNTHTPYFFSQVVKCNHCKCNWNHNVNGTLLHYHLIMHCTTSSFCYPSRVAAAYHVGIASSVRTVWFKFRKKRFILLRNTFKLFASAWTRLKCAGTSIMHSGCWKSLPMFARARRQQRKKDSENAAWCVYTREKFNSLLKLPTMMLVGELISAWCACLIAGGKIRGRYCFITHYP